MSPSIASSTIYQLFSQSRRASLLSLISCPATISLLNIMSVFKITCKRNIVLKYILKNQKNWQSISSSASAATKLSAVFGYQLQLTESAADKTINCILFFSAETYKSALCISKTAANSENSSQVSASLLYILQLVIQTICILLFRIDLLFYCGLTFHLLVFYISRAYFLLPLGIHSEILTHHLHKCWQNTQLTVQFVSNGKPEIAVQDLDYILPLAQLFAAESPIHVRLTITIKFLTPKINNLAETVLSIDYLISNTVTKFPQSNKSKFLSRAKETSKKKTETQKKLILTEDNCYIRVRAWKKIIALKIWPDVTSQNKNKNIRSKLYSQRYIIGEESTLFSSHEAKLNPVSDEEML